MWKRIPGFSKYEVSDVGEVRRAERVGPWLPGKCGVWTSNNGYSMTDMTSDEGVCKSISIHRLVMAAFVRPALPGEQVRHMDGRKFNNRLDNLRYGSASDNARDKLRHGTHREGEAINTAKLSPEIVLAIVESLTIGGSYPEIAAKFSTSKSIVSAIARGITWKHITGGIDRRNGSKYAHRGGAAAAIKRSRGGASA